MEKQQKLKLADRAFKTNRSLILEKIRANKLISRAEIAKELGIGRSTVSEIIDSLLKEKIVYEVGYGESTSQGGRRPIKLAFNPKAAYVVGVDIGGTKTLICITDLDGNFIYQKKFSTVPSNPNEFFQHVQAEIDAGLGVCELHKENLLGIGIGIPAMIEFSTGRVVNCPALGWENINAREIIKRYYNGPIYIDNDVNVAALGERWKGDARGITNLFMMTIGTGVGSALILNGKLCRGANNLAGEIGYFIIDGEKDLEGNLQDFGAFEKTTSGTGITSRAKHMLSESTQPSMIRELVNDKMEAITSEHVFQAAAQGDSFALEILELPIRHTAIGIANVVSLLNPEVVVIGGGISQAGDLYIEPIKRLVTKLTPITTKIIPASLGNDAGAIGAIAGVLEMTNNLVITE
jgi:glucokinase